MVVELNEELGSITVEIDKAQNANGIIIIGHGAGAGMHHPFMVDLAKLLAEKGLHAVRFNFPYMEQGRKSPGSPKKNIETWRLITKHIQSHHPSLQIILSGKSYGGRMASHLLSEETPDNVVGIVYFGFPLHAPGKDSKDRANHLEAVQVPQLFLQGTNDKLANIMLMEDVVATLANGSLVKFEGADHSFNVPKKLNISKSEMIEQLVAATTSFQEKLL